MKPAIIFNLTYYWFDMIASGLKHSEYREYSTYWNKRIGRLKAGSIIEFRRAYSKTAVKKEVINISIINKSDIDTSRDEQLTEFFKDSRSSTFWKIYFKESDV